MGALPAQLNPLLHPKGATYAPPQPNDPASLQAAIIARLQSRITGLEITEFPDDPDNWELTAQTGAILVGYRGTRYTPPDNSDLTVVQDCHADFECAVLIR